MCVQSSAQYFTFQILFYNIQYIVFAYKFIQLLFYIFVYNIGSPCFNFHCSTSHESLDGIQFTIMDIEILAPMLQEFGLSMVNK